VRFGGTAAEVDLIACADGIAIEIDGYHHFTDAESYRRDRRKDLLLQTQGLIVIRVLAEDVVKDARGAIDLVCQALAYRLGAKQ
jgi:very-short-patch-repair endonuclease